MHIDSGTMFHGLYTPSPIRSRVIDSTFLSPADKPFFAHCSGIDLAQKVIALILKSNLESLWPLVSLVSLEEVTRAAAEILVKHDFLQELNLYQYI